MGTALSVATTGAIIERRSDDSQTPDRGWANGRAGLAEVRLTAPAIIGTHQQAAGAQERVGRFAYSAARGNVKEVHILCHDDVVRPARRPEVHGFCVPSSKSVKAMRFDAEMVTEPMGQRRGRLSVDPHRPIS